MCLNLTIDACLSPLSWHVRNQLFIAHMHIHQCSTHAPSAQHVVINNYLFGNLKWWGCNYPCYHCSTTLKLHNMILMVIPTFLACPCFFCGTHSPWKLELGFFVFVFCGHVRARKVHYIPIKTIKKSTT